MTVIDVASKWVRWRLRFEREKHWEAIRFSHF